MKWAYIVSNNGQFFSRRLLKFKHFKPYAAGASLPYLVYWTMNL